MSAFLFVKWRRRQPPHRWAGAGITIAGKRENRLVTCEAPALGGQEPHLYGRPAAGAASRDSLCATASGPEASRTAAYGGRSLFLCEAGGVLSLWFFLSFPHPAPTSPGPEAQRVPSRVMEQSGVVVSVLKMPRGL